MSNNKVNAISISGYVFESYVSKNGFPSTNSYPFLTKHDDLEDSDFLEIREKITEFLLWMKNNNALVSSALPSAYSRNIKKRMLDFLIWFDENKILDQTKSSLDGKNKEVQNKIIGLLEWLKEKKYLEKSDYYKAYREDPVSVKYYGYDEDGNGKIKDIKDKETPDDVVSINGEKIERKRGRKPKIKQVKRKTSGAKKQKKEIKPKTKIKGKVGRPKKVK